MYAWRRMGWFEWVFNIEFDEGFGLLGCVHD